MEKIDRRVRRTRRRLREALIDSIIEKGYEAITIQDITDRADLSRATFYLHYKDKQELLANSLEEMFDELVESVKEPLFSKDWATRPTPPAVFAFEHVAAYSVLYKKLLLGDTGIPYVIHRELRYLSRIAEQQILLLLDHPDQQAGLPVPLKVMAQHVAGSLFTIILWWLENDMPYPPEEMARMFHEMNMPGILAGLGKYEQIAARIEAQKEVQKQALHKT